MLTRMLGSLLGTQVKEAPRVAAFPLTAELLSEFRHVGRMPFGCLHNEVFWGCPARRRH